MAHSVAYRISESEVADSIPGLSQYAFRGLMMAIATKFIPLSPLSICFGNGHVGKNILRSTGKKKKYQESMGRCTGRHNITEITLKTTLNTIKSYHQSKPISHGLIFRLQKQVILVLSRLTVYRFVKIYGRSYLPSCIFAFVIFL